MGGIEKWLEEHKFVAPHHPKKKRKTKAERKAERKLLAKHHKLHHEAMRR